MSAKYRSHGDHGLYFDREKNRWIGSVELDTGPDGKRVRKVVSGKTKTEVKDKLKTLSDELAAGVRTSGTYTVSLALDDWLASLRGKSAVTVTNYTHIAAHFRPYLGKILLKDLTARDVAAALTKPSRRRCRPGRCGWCTRPWNVRSATQRSMTWWAATWPA